MRNGKRLVTDGPFAETREQLGGYYLIDAKDLDEAMSIAERVPVAKSGTIEIRPGAGDQRIASAVAREEKKDADEHSFKTKVYGPDES